MASLRLRALLVLASGPLAVLAQGCGSDDSNSPPILEPLSDRIEFVDTDVTIELHASDPDGDPISFAFTSDITDIATRANLRPAGNTAVFTWTPIASDLGQHSFDFTASDGKASTKETITITVQAGTEGTGPIFRQPLGSGTTLDLSKQKCLNLQVVVEDPDSANVEIKEEEPRIASATLDQDSGLTAKWSWCPGKEQIAATDRYNLRLSASDGSNPAAIKDYLIVLRRTFDPSCAGQAPQITHTPHDESTVVGLSIFADVSDDEGIKYEPLLYYSTTSPGDPPDLAQMSQVTMVLLDGDMKSGSWGADVPNPVAGKPAGTSADLYYILVAQDNDDENGSCDHLTQAPATGAFKMTVTNPGGAGGLGLCEPCTADAQCGGASDLCLYMGPAGDTYCFKACTSDADCGDPAYYCSLTEFVSVDNAKGRQCIPKSFRCETGSGGTCTDDSYEPNDTLADASLIFPALESGTYPGLKSCPSSTAGADEDWYPVDIYNDTQVTVSMSGGTSTDLDLAITDDHGNVVAKSDGLTSNEQVSACLKLGTYYVHVYSWQQGENTYSLTVTEQSQSCGGGGSCTDDPEENDDNASQARLVDLNLGPYKSDTNAICSGDEDWYKVDLYASETIYVTLAFDQANAAEDLDVLFYQGSTLLTPCTEANTSGCDVDNGQSGDSNETFHKTVSTTGTYYVVVRGWDGSENLYDICIGLAPGDCPLP